MFKKNAARKIALVGMLAAVSSVLMFLDFPLPIFPSFIKLDFSDLPALIGAFMLGPIVGVLIELVKNLIHLTQSSTAGIGELANFIVGAALVFPAGLVYKFRRNRCGALLGMAVGTVCMAVAAALSNYYILIPFFASRFMPLEAIISMGAAIIPSIDSLLKLILLSIVPFNLFKAVLVCAVTLLAYKRLSRALRLG